MIREHADIPMPMGHTQTQITVLVGYVLINSCHNYFYYTV